MTDGHDLVQRYYRLMDSTPDDAGVAELYAPSAMVIRFDGRARGVAEITEFLVHLRGRHDPYDLHTLEQITRAGDVVMWDALVTTEAGILETTDVFVLDEAGLIERHIPGIRGYWGQ